jgi:proline iminopeptidase
MLNQGLNFIPGYPMNKLLPLSVIFAISYAATAAEIIIPTVKEYLGGKALCDSYATQIQFEKGFYTKVPVDYSNPTAGQFEVYSWFQGDFLPERPTLVYFTGGPGQGTHWGQGALTGEYNLLLVDQRGIACSRPRTYKEYLDPAFYSSKNVALDLEEIRKSLKIEKWSIYGVSYGTIPATIYGSMFPAHTISIILEGVAFDAETLWKHNRRKDVIRDVINAQEAIVQHRLINIQQYEVDPVWFFSWAKDQLLMNEGRADLSDKLSRLSDTKEFEDFVAMLQSQYGPQESFPRNELYLLNEVPYYMLACQEMGVLDYETDITWGEDGVIVPSSNKDIISNCAKINAQSKSLYSATNYPLKVPTFYFQGENDSATEAQGAYNHFKLVAKGPKQLFLMSEGGHNPNLEILRNDVEAEKALFSYAINGDKVSKEDIEFLNTQLTTLKWKYLE